MTVRLASKVNGLVKISKKKRKKKGKYLCSKFNKMCKIRRVAEKMGTYERTGVSTTFIFINYNMASFFFCIVERIRDFVNAIGSLSRKKRAGIVDIYTHPESGPAVVT